MTAAPPPSVRRARDDSAHELGFTRQHAVRWLAPRVLIATGAKALLAAIFGAYADKRELQGSLPWEVYRYTSDGSGTDGGELWLDYVADLGDGFDATYSVATVLAQREIDVGDATLPRGRLLVMGGDQVYPAASIQTYRDRTRGVYQAAFPEPDGEPRPALFALPGNHDWYDGLTAFLRVFAQQRSFGAWCTEQTRSYFAVELPQRWWLFAIDTQFDDHIDAPQLAYFAEAAARLEPGDAVILCTPSPAWVYAGSHAGEAAYDIIEFFDAEFVRPAGASIRVMLSGDKHHYSRYAERDGSRQNITCGLGGAYLAATHELPEQVELPPPTTRVREAEPRGTYDLAGRYPSKWQSRLFAAGIFRLPWRNPGFWGMTGLVQSAVTLAVLFGIAGPFGGGERGFFALVASWTPAVILGGLLVLAGIFFARMDSHTPRRPATVAGSLHGVAHIALNVTWALGIIQLHRLLPPNLVTEWTTLLLIVVGTPLVLGFAHSELVAAYLVIASRFGINLNEVMAGQSIEDHKGFLRLHIATDGTLTIHPIAISQVCRTWRADPDGAPSDPLLRPVGVPPAPTRIEEPIVVPRAE
ncbi:hypothetical protein [Haloechinothrix halophila]|uniref:hypothetical protein n=1 Tax=Haloechinothrix halophila TaxID=1069073 RepID=UPI000413C821|nr:hypothetical protein [Haloechinothrix halophila]